MSTPALEDDRTGEPVPDDTRRAPARALPVGQRVGRGDADRAVTRSRLPAGPITGEGRKTDTEGRSSTQAVSIAVGDGRRRRYQRQVAVPPNGL